MTGGMVADKAAILGSSELSLATFATTLELWPVDRQTFAKWSFRLH